MVIVAWIVFISLVGFVITNFILYKKMKVTAIKSIGCLRRSGRLFCRILL